MPTILPLERMVNTETSKLAKSQLLMALDLEDSIVTIDAMGCQSEIAEGVIAKKADYILAVKANQQ